MCLCAFVCTFAATILSHCSRRLDLSILQVLSHTYVWQRAFVSPIHRGLVTNINLQSAFICHSDIYNSKADRQRSCRGPPSKREEFLIWSIHFPPIYSVCLSMYIYEHLWLCWVQERLNLGLLSVGVHQAAASHFICGIHKGSSFKRFSNKCGFSQRATKMLLLCSLMAVSPFCWQERTLQEMTGFDRDCFFLRVKHDKNLR